MPIPFRRDCVTDTARDNFAIARRDPVWLANWLRQTQQLRQEAYVFYFVFRDPQTHWYVRLVAACCAAYVFSPVQLIPNFIPLIGCLDDVLVLLLGAKMVQRMTPPDVLQECRALAEAAETRRKEKTRSQFARLGLILVATSWLLATFAASAAVAAYVYR